MEDTAPANELERRKRLRLRLRPDLSIEAHKYEGRTYYVVKDPVSLRYWRLKDHEHFLLQFMDGARTLEDAQKAYEKHYRPDRLKLEDLESFAQQLLTGGLAQNETPRAGKLLYDRRKKRRRNEMLQMVTNILYIKVPILDPDRLLTRMVPWFGWIFSGWFFALSLVFMLSAVTLVAANFELFLSKLPDYHEFFSFKTVVYLWAALGVVKVIHEFGHGLSCKKFGGEVHEMGFLFLCLSPAMYCNVSDSWMLPNKWSRIIISSAGIYVELVIAAASTWVWWYTPSQPFVHNLALSLMIVCSASTLFFNANPLMRYDGYYILADWLEIPNLRERSNRFLTNLFLEWCLGVEVQREEYMALWRRLLFVAYAVGSYIYRWVVTFGILWFMNSFLKPWHLEVLGRLLAVAAAASMICWPIYRVGKDIYKRGRLPDMKRWRVVSTALVLLGVVLFVCCVPLPINRVGGRGVVQPRPEATTKVFVRYPGLLERLNVHSGQHVEPGEELAVFRNPDLEKDLADALTQLRTQQEAWDVLSRQKDATREEEKRDLLGVQMSEVEDLREKAAVKIQTLRKIRDQDLVLVASRGGRIGEAPPIEDVGKFFEKNTEQAFCTIDEPRRLRVCLPVPTNDFNRLKEDLERETPAAVAARRRLQQRVTVAYDHARLGDVFVDLAAKVSGLRLEADEADGVSHDLQVTFRGDNLRLATVLDRLFEQEGLGYIVRSEAGAKDDGWLKVRPGRERGLQEGPRPLANLGATICVHGRDDHVFKGTVAPLPLSEARDIPLPLTSRAGGPIAVKARPDHTGTLVPQTQHYLVYIDIEEADDAVTNGNLAEVKINCQPETCLHWLWRTLNNTFDLRLM